MRKNNDHAPATDAVGQPPPIAARDEVLVATRALVGIAARSLGALSNDVTLAQYRVLVLLDGRGPLTMSALADSLGVNRSGVTRLCDALVDKRLIRRRPAEGSRRSVCAELTARGRSTVQQVMRRRARLINDALARMDPADIASLTTGLTAFSAAAGELAGSAWQLGWPTTDQAPHPASEVTRPGK